jgi:hypothetical protein
MTLDLAEGVFAVEIDGDIVFMDTKADTYLALPSRQDGGLAALLQGDAGSIADELTDIGILVRGGHRRATGAAPPPAAARDLVTSWPSARHGSLADLPHLLIGSLRTWAAIRWSSPKHWLRPIAAGRRPDMTEAEVAAAAARLPHLLLFVPFVRRCLPKAMLCRRLLSRQGISVSWVFGVRAHPFEAHCWLQWRDIVLDDRLEHVRRYTPIFHV